jgi:hypothetical protein
MSILDILTPEDRALWFRALRSFGFDDGWGYWLSGFIDGEAHFAIANFTRSSLQCHMAIALRCDDVRVLYECQRRTRLGRIHDTSRPSETHPQNKPYRSWHIAGKSETLLLTAILDRYPLRARKREDYEVWREAVHVHNSMPFGNRARGADWEPMWTLKRRLEQVRKFNPESIHL